MTRIVQVTVPAAKADEIIKRVRSMNGLLGLQIERAASVLPQGDVVTLVLADRMLMPLMELLGELGVSESADSTITISEPAAAISAAMRQAGETPGEATWEEVENTLAKDRDAGIDSLVVMLVSGILAGVGLGTGMLHLVIAAMVIGPGFEPFTRIAMGMISRRTRLWWALATVLKRYLAVFVGAGIATLMLKILAIAPFTGTDAHLPLGALLFEYWTFVTGVSLSVAAAAAVAGTLLLISGRTTFTGGLMIALALIPSVSIAGMAMATGRWDVMGQALWRWGVEGALVTAVSFATLSWKRSSLRRIQMR